MNDFIQRFKEDLQLSGYAERSIQSYIGSVLRLQRFYNKPLEEITEEELRQYWLCCQSEFGWSAAFLRISYSGISHFFKKTIIRSWNIFKEIKWKRDETLPTILSLAGSSKDYLRSAYFAKSYILSDFIFPWTPAAGSNNAASQGYSLGPGIGAYIHAGKGALDRMVPLPKITLESLRKYYRTHQNPKWIFPAMGRNGGKDARFTQDHVSDSGVQGVLQRTLKRLGFKKHIHPHVFRHAYATHLLTSQYSHSPCAKDSGP